MPKTKQFTAARNEADQKPIEFELDGETFSVPTPLDAMTLMDLADMADHEGAEALAAFKGFLKGLLAEDYKRFSNHARSVRLDIEGFLEIVQYIITEATGRPTEQQSDSQVSPLKNTTPSPVAATSAA